jgi:hypothetical protein
MRPLEDLNMTLVRRNTKPRHKLIKEESCVGRTPQLCHGSHTSAIFITPIHLIWLVATLLNFHFLKNMRIRNRNTILRMAFGFLSNQSSHDRHVGIVKLKSTIPKGGLQLHGIRRGFHENQQIRYV